MGGHGFHFLGLPAPCPRMHAKTMRAARQMQSEQVSISGRIKGVYRHQLGASHRFHVQNVLRARPQRRSKRGRQQQAGSGLSKLAGELLHLHSPEIVWAHTDGIQGLCLYSRARVQSRTGVQWP